MHADRYLARPDVLQQELLDPIDAALAGQRHHQGRVGETALSALSNPAEAQPIDTLSTRERQVATMVARGMSSAAIGQALSLSPKTVASYRSRLMAKLGVGVGDVAGLVRFASATAGWTPTEARPGAARASRPPPHRRPCTTRTQRERE